MDLFTSQSYRRRLKRCSYRESNTMKRSNTFNSRVSVVMASPVFDKGYEFTPSLFVFS